MSKGPSDDDAEKQNAQQRLSRKRKSRWQDTEDDSVLSGLPTVIPPGLTKAQEEQYIMQLQIEEITRRLRSGELGIPQRAEDRSPSPEPIYGPDGKRTNTREIRVRKKLEEERHKLILIVMKTNPEYKPPFDYKPTNIKVSEKIVIPQEDYPLLNFVGLLIGPRGNTLKTLEKETGATIIIRGKGSVKEGKLGTKNGIPLPGQDEPLHAYVTSTNPDSVKKAIERIKEIIKEGIAIPDGDNDLRRQQLRELALLNGTLREGDALSKLKQLQQAQSIVTNTILCTVCGGAGHIAPDCKQKRPSESLKAALLQQSASSSSPSSTAGADDKTLATATTTTPSFADRLKMDNEYLSLMAELGQPVSTSPSSSSSSSLSSLSSSSLGALSSSSSSSSGSSLKQPISSWNPSPGPPTHGYQPMRMPHAPRMPSLPPWQQSLNNGHSHSRPSIPLLSWQNNGLSSTQAPPPPPLSTSSDQLPWQRNLNHLSPVHPPPPPPVQQFWGGSPFCPPPPPPPPPPPED